MAGPDIADKDEWAWVSPLRQSHRLGETHDRFTPMQN
jgi:hypothetical protein